MLAGLGDPVEAARRAWFVGDAVADLEAAEDHGVAFVYMRRYSNVKDLFDADLRPHCSLVAETPAELAARLSSFA